MRIDGKYLEFLEQKAAESVLKIPKHLPPGLLSDRQLMRALSVYFELKPLFYNGELYRARQRRATLAKFLNMSPAAYAYKLKRLINEGFCHYDKAGTLYLCSWKYFFYRMGKGHEDRRRMRFYRIKNEYYNTWKFVLFYAIAENFEQQAHAIEQKIIKTALSDSAGLSLAAEVAAITKNKAIALKDRQRRVNFLIAQYEAAKDNPSKYKVKKFKKAGGIAHAFREAQLYNERAIYNYNTKNPINTRITVSCEKFAQLIGLTSSSSGYYWQQFFKECGFMRVQQMPSIFQPHAVGMHRADDEHFYYFNGRKPKDVFKRWGVYRRLANDIKLVRSFEAV